VIKIQVFGVTPPCMRCQATERVVREVVQELGVEAEVVKEDVMSEEARRVGVMMSPAVVIEGKVVKAGGVPTKEEIRRAIEALGA